MAEIRNLEAGKLLCLEGHGSRPQIDQAFEKIMLFVKDKKVPIKGDRLTLFYDNPEELNHEEAHFAAAVELSGEVYGDGEVLVVTQAMMKVACQIHSGSLDTIATTLQSLKNWIHEHGYKIIGPIREYYISPASTDEPTSTAVTEIQIPITNQV